jgi:hypothetical protein
MNTDITPLVSDLNAMIKKGQLLEAFEKYYADNVVMQENTDEPRVGKELNRKSEEAFVGGVIAFNDIQILNSAVKGNVAMNEHFMDFTHKDWGRAARTQVSVQQWKDGKIVSERFYYGK